MIATPPATSLVGGFYSPIYQHKNFKIMYVAKNFDTDQFIPGVESFSRREIREIMEWEFPDVKNWGIVRVDRCRGCGRDNRDTYVDERRDYYGISTGHWCDSCFNSSAYPYRRDAYDPYNEMGTR